MTWRKLSDCLGWNLCFELKLPKGEEFYICHLHILETIILYDATSCILMPLVQSQTLC